jgi:hypothetical protein
MQTFLFKFPTIYKYCNNNGCLTFSLHDFQQATIEDAEVILMKQVLSDFGIKQAGNLSDL